MRIPTTATSRAANEATAPSVRLQTPPLSAKRTTVDEAQTPSAAVRQHYVFEINDLEIGMDTAMTSAQAAFLAALENFR